MKSLVNLLLSLTLLHFLAAPAARGPTGSRVVARQSASDSNLTPTTVEGRQNAVKELEASVSTALNEGNKLEAARGLARIGSLKLLLNDPSGAIATHSQSLELLKETPNTEIEVNDLVGMGNAYNLLSNVELGQQSLDRALALSGQINYTRGEAEALLALSDFQNRKSHTTAVATAQAALDRWKSLNDKDGMGRTYIQLGIYYFAQTLLSEASENFTQALQIWRGLNNPARQAESVIGLGYVEHRRGDWQAEIDRYTEAYAMLDENAEPLKAGQIASGLGAAFNELGLFDEAVGQYQRALEFYRRTNYQLAVDYALGGIGRSYYLKGDLPQAYNYLQQSLESQADAVSSALSVEYLGRIHLDRGEYPAAIEKLESALETYTKAGNPNETSRVLALLGKVYDQQGVVARAKNYYDDALVGFTKLEDRVNEAAVYYALGRLELKQKNYDAAGDYLRRSIDATENIRRIATSDDLTAAFSATVQERYEAYIDCLMKKHQQQPAAGFAVKAFETSELGRVRALSERLNAIQTNTNAGVDPQLAAQEKSLRLGLRALENAKIKLLARKNAQDELKTLEEQIARLESNYKQVSDELRAQDPLFDEISKPSSWNLQQIRQQILRDDDAVIVEYSLGSENSYAWTVTRDNMKSFELPAQNTISDAARHVYALLSSEPNAGSDTNLAQSTAQLSDLVLKPLASELNKERIIVVADGALNYIPFQLLPLNSVDGQPLISRYEVVNVPSVSVLGQLRQERSKRPAPDQVLAAFGDPVFPADYAQRTGSNPSVLAAGIQPAALTTLHRALRDVEIAGDSFDLSAVQRLIYSERELSNLRQISGPRSLIASGFDASREALEKTDLSHYAILHLATHAVFDPKRPEISGFLLSLVDRKGNPLDGFMTLEDVYRLQAPVDLVVLSACRTGLGKDVRGEGLIGLTRGFMHAGASSVAASLWNVDDEATAELMKHFYANMLQKRMAPAAALRAAQNTIRQQPQWKSPHFWAAFTLHGEYNETIRARPASEFSRNMIIGTVSLFVLALLSYWYLRRSKAAREVKTT